MTANINSETGIAFGYVSANELDSDLVQELLYGTHTTNHSYDAWVESCYEDGSDPDDCADNYYSDEEQISGTYEGVTYCTSWLGGALNFFITNSSVITEVAEKASPCVPNAGILSAKMDGSTQSYSVPQDWWNTQI